jgi:alkylation response protein AidB-like acyl-CoA dehydrogenase
MSMNASQAAWMTEEHEMFADSVIRFAQEDIHPHIERWAEQGYVEREFWKKAGDAGILGAAIPEEYGGFGGGLSFDVVTGLVLGRYGDSAWGWGIQSIVVHYLLAFATEEQKQRWLPGLASGERVPAIAMSEPGAGSDLQSVRTRGVLEGDHYVLNGSKTFITNGQTANLICVVTKTGDQQGARGISLLMLETDGSEGFRRGRNLDKIGLKGQDTSELFFENVRIPAANLLGGEGGRGFYQLMEQLPWERLMIGVSAVGTMEAAIAETLEYVGGRKAFGQRIADFQNTRFTLAECKTKLEVTRSFVHDCVAKLLEGKLDPATASMAKYWGSDTLCEVIDECLQLHGGYGYMMEYPIARMYTDARVSRIYGGSNEIMKELIARSLEA